MILFNNNLVPKVSHLRCKNSAVTRNKEYKEVNITLDLNPNKRHKTKKDFTGLYTVVNPEKVHHDQIFEQRHVHGLLSLN